VAAGVMDAAVLYGSPNALAADYSRFDVANRLLLTGHSHQAWPDRALEGQRQAWDDAARLVDEKWERAIAVAERVKRGYARLLGEPGADIALGQSTFDLVTKLLSALPLRERPRVVTTDGEFHSIRRLLDRWAEEGLEVVRVPAYPAATAADRLAAAIDDRTAAALVSSVYYLTAHIVPRLGHVADACRRHGARLVVDAYHHLNVVPFAIAADGLEDAYVTGGGYKYCQLGEGNAFLRLPPGCELRPALTGWFAEFSARAAAVDGAVAYGPGADRFAGATYDPTSHYRAAAVFDFFEERGLDAGLLREVSRHQVERLAAGFDALDVDPAVADRDRAVPLAEVGGFLALRTPHAGTLFDALRRLGVLTDHRADVLRLGPAPYLSDAQLDEAIAVLGACVRELRRDGRPDATRSAR
jgi:kynureninase